MNSDILTNISDLQNKFLEWHVNDQNTLEISFKFRDEQYFLIFQRISTIHNMVPSAKLAGRVNISPADLNFINFFDEHFTISQNTGYHLFNAEKTMEIAVRYFKDPATMRNTINKENRCVKSHSQKLPRPQGICLLKDEQGKNTIESAPKTTFQKIELTPIVVNSTDEIPGKFLEWHENSQENLELVFKRNETNYHVVFQKLPSQAIKPAASLVGRVNIAPFDLEFISFFDNIFSLSDIGYHIINKENHLEAYVRYFPNLKVMKQTLEREANQTSLKTESLPTAKSDSLLEKAPLLIRSDSVAKHLSRTRPNSTHEASKAKHSKIHRCVIA